MNKSRVGNFFEDFELGQLIRHATPRTVTAGDAALYIGLTGSRDPLASSMRLACQLGFERSPIESFLVFNIAFGKTVPDLSLNAVANLGYADLRFLQPVYDGDTISVTSEIIGLRENTNGKSGIVYVRSCATNQYDQPILTWVRWVMVHKRGDTTSSPVNVVPSLPGAVDVTTFPIAAYGGAAQSISVATGISDFWEQYEAGERIEHPSAMTINDSDHSIATRLYQNTAKAHFDGHLMAKTVAGKRLVYGGHVISVCRALAYDGLENVLSVIAVNAGTHVAPTYAGDTLACATTVVEKLDLNRSDVGALRLRMIGAKNVSSSAISFPERTANKANYGAEVVLDIDYVVTIPRQPR